MKQLFELNKLSIAVLSNGNNPSILNKDFLINNGIISDSWEVKDVIITPPFSRIAFDNGVIFIVEEAKVTFECISPEKIDWKSEIPRIASAYLSTLHHVQYHAIGHNFTIINKLESNNLDKLIINELVKDGPWLNEFSGISSSIIYLSYKKTTPNVSIKIESTIKKTEKEAETGIMVSANFHYDFQPGDIDSETKYINSMPKYYEELITYIKTLP